MLENNSNIIFEKKFQDILFALDQSFIIATSNTRGDITYVNKKFCEISKYTAENLIGQNYRIIKSDFHSDKFFKKMWRSISTGKIWTSEIKNRTKNGEFYWINTTIIPFLNKKGRAYQYIAIGFDITDKKILQEKIQSSNALLKQILVERNLRNQFVSHLAHDLKTPLMSATLSAQLIKKNIKNPEKIEHFFKKIIPNLKRVDTMISDFLDANTLEVGKKIKLEFQKCEMRDILKEAIENLTTIYGDRFLVKYHGDTSGLWNPFGIERIIENLGSNASKYGSPEALVDITIVGTHDQIELAVHNEGRPLSPIEKENIFHYLYRTNSAENSGKEGWGMGLTLVRGLTEAHGGLVRVEDGEDFQGVTFRIILPRDSRAVTKE